MATDFKCPRCKKTIKVGRLHAKYNCPRCNTGLLITREEKQQGKLEYKKARRYFIKKY